MKKVVSLNRLECLIVRMTAEARIRNNQNQNVPNERKGKQGDRYLETNGMGGEFAFCKAFGIFPDFTLPQKAIKRPAADVHFFGGTLDIKTTHYENGRLIVEMHKKNKRCDYYALVVGELPQYSIIGWATGEEVFLDRNIIDLGYGDLYALEQDQLHEFDEALFRI